MRIERWFWDGPAYRLAGLLIRLGVNRSRRLWLTVRRLSQELAGLCLLMEDPLLPGNTIYWAWQQGDPEGEDESVDELLDGIATKIERAPVPFGGDDYLIMLRQFAALPGEEQGVSLSDLRPVKRTLRGRRLAFAANLTGNRWSDWKRGDGRAALRGVLLRSAPTPCAPLTMIGIIVLGRAVGRALLRFEGKRPAF